MDQCTADKTLSSCEAQQPASSTAGDSSSAPVGAIVGGVVGGGAWPPGLRWACRQQVPLLTSCTGRLSSTITVCRLLCAVVVLAALAFLALRPGKGWLRHKAVQGQAGSIDSCLTGSKPVTPILSLASDGGKDPRSPPLVPPHGPNALSMLADVEAQRSSHKAPGSSSSALPDSYVSTGGSSGALAAFRGPGPNSARWVVGSRFECSLAQSSVRGRCCPAP